MLKTGRKCIQGHQMEMMLIRLFVLLCWLLPMVVELLIRRLLSPDMILRREVQIAVLAGSFLLNRLLVAGAHGGYFACCHRLAIHTGGNTSATCRIETLHGGLLSGSLLTLFFRYYRHPLQALRRQLQWDGCRMICYAIAVFPGIWMILLWRENEGVCAWLFGAGGILILLLGFALMRVFLSRLLPAVYLWDDYPTFGAAVMTSLRRSHRTMQMRLLRQIYTAVLWWAPPLQAMLDIGYIVVWQQGEIRKKSSSIFYTRTLRT